jgi:hypothetical protein
MTMKSTLYPLAFVLILASCKDNTVTVYVHDQGTYQGHVTQYAVDGSVAADQTGATIAIKGTAYSATTDAAGNYKLQNVPAGIYDLIFAKAGYDSCAIAQNQFSGAGTVFVDTQRIQSLPTDSITVTSATLHLDSIDRYIFQNEPRADTFYTLTLGVHISGPNASTLTRAWVAISKDVPNADTTYLGDEGHAITQGVAPSIVFRDGGYLTYRTKILRRSDHINVFLRAYAQPPAGMPYFNTPASPFLTTKKIVVQ